MKKLIKSKQFIATIITVLCVIVAFILSAVGIIETLHLSSINMMFSLRGPSAVPDTSIVIVTVDDLSMASLPSKWPYPTSYYARLVRNLTSAGAKLIVFDIEFTEPNVDDPQSDVDFAKAINDADNVVLATKIVYEMGSFDIENRHMVKLLPPLVRSSASVGLVNMIEDIDGFLRRYLLFQNINERTYYSLAIEALRKLEDSVIPEDQNLFGPVLQVGDRKIIKITPNTIMINYRGPAETFRTYSIASVLDDSEFNMSDDEDTDVFEMHKEWGTFRDKIVFIGASAEELQDIKNTPFLKYEGKQRKMPGVEIHANALSTILRGDYFRYVNIWLQVLGVLVLAFVACLVTLRIKPFKALGTVVGMSLLSALLVFVLFAKFNLIIMMTSPIMAILLSFVTSLLYQTVIEQREKRRIRQTFQQYVAPAVVDKMLSSGVLPSYGGERRELTVLFSDIRKFTTFSESREPEVVVSRLSEYLTEMVEVIFNNNGTLDKFVGDEIMALFGAPYYLDDHAEKACHTAVAMLDRLRELQKRWSADKKGYFNIGIGINTGNVIVGNLGSSQLFDYTVIGDEVNLGARLEGANKQYATTVILSESTYNLVSDVAKVRELDLVRVVGKKRPIRIFELRGMNSLPQIEQDYIIDVFSEGLRAYRERRWADALKGFRRVLRYFPSDGPSRIYTMRCLDYIENPPPHDWDGVFEMKTK
jgi:adenylate cyclase